MREAKKHRIAEVGAATLGGAAGYTAGDFVRAKTAAKVVKKGPGAVLGVGLGSLAAGTAAGSYGGYKAMHSAFVSHRSTHRGKKV